MKVYNQTTGLQLYKETTVRPKRGETNGMFAVDDMLPWFGCTANQAITRTVNVVLNECTPNYIKDKFASVFHLGNMAYRIDYRVDVISRASAVAFDDIYSSEKELCFVFTDVYNLLPSYTVPVLDVFLMCDNKEKFTDENIKNNVISLLLTYVYCKFGESIDAVAEYVNTTHETDTVKGKDVEFFPYNNEVVYTDPQDSFFDTRDEIDKEYKDGIEFSKKDQEADAKEYAKYLKYGNAIYDPDFGKKKEEPKKEHKTFKEKRREKRAWKNTIALYSKYAKA